MINYMWKFRNNNSKIFYSTESLYVLKFYRSMSNLDQLSCKPLLSIWRYWQYQEYSHLSEEKKTMKILQNS